jgi:hypothetical protein
MGEREIASEPPPPLPDTPTIQVLSRPDFEQAVRQALRDFHRPTELKVNPLMRSRLIVDNGTEPGDVESLRALIQNAAASLKATPRDEKLYRAIHRTYLQPAGSQEQAAELLGLPFNTYRYHLSGGIRRITDDLWKIELGM